MAAFRLLFAGIVSNFVYYPRKKKSIVGSKEPENRQNLSYVRGLLGRIVGIDFGKVRIGLAISDEMRIIAQPLKTIKATNDPKQTAKMIVQALSVFKNIDTIVIGMPLLLSGKEGEMAQLVRAFAKILEQELPLPLIFWDERLTSSGVEKMLLDSDVSRKKRAELSDALAAVSILQNYLDSLRK